MKAAKRVWSAILTAGLLSGMCCPGGRALVSDERLPDNYRQVLDLMYYNIITDWDIYGRENGSPWNPVYGENALSNIGYILIDLDENGVPELLISKVDESGSWGGIIYELYTTLNGTAFPLARSSLQATYYLCEDNVIFCMCSTDAEHAYFESLYVHDGMYDLDIQSCLEYNGTYHEGTSQWLLWDSPRYEDGFYVTDSFTCVSDERAFEIQGSYQTKEPALHLFTDYQPSISFDDVTYDNNRYCFAPVIWAVLEGVTKGTGEKTFSPDLICTHEQILTLLWRLQGGQVSNAPCPFPDVDPSSPYYMALCWANERGMMDNGITEMGIPCTRSQTVLYFWKLSGRPDAAGSTQFEDVPRDSDYATAVAWAIEQGLTTGTGETTFSPDMTCTRGQIVTFLYRDSRFGKYNFSPVG